MTYEASPVRHLRIGRVVVDAIESNPGIGQSPPSEQFSCLISTPLEQVAETLRPGGPIVIVLDALDECSTTDKSFREELGPATGEPRACEGDREVGGDREEGSSGTGGGADSERCVGGGIDGIW